MKLHHRHEGYVMQLVLADDHRIVLHCLVRSTHALFLSGMM